MTISPIPMSEILAYAKYFHICAHQEREVLLERVRILDRVFLEWHHKQSEEQK